jgi:hypothetical protein
LQFINKSNPREVYLFTIGKHIDSAQAELLKRRYIKSHPQEWAAVQRASKGKKRGRRSIPIESKYTGFQKPVEEQEASVSETKRNESRPVLGISNETLFLAMSTRILKEISAQKAAADSAIRELSNSMLKLVEHLKRVNESDGEFRKDVLKIQKDHVSELKAIKKILDYKLPEPLNSIEQIAKDIKTVETVNNFLDSRACSELAKQARPQPSTMQSSIRNYTLDRKSSTNEPPRAKNDTPDNSAQNLNSRVCEGRKSGGEENATNPQREITLSTSQVEQILTETAQKAVIATAKSIMGAIQQDHLDKIWKIKAALGDNPGAHQFSSFLEELFVNHLSTHDTNG